MRWTDRLLGLFSTLILARLLVPEDFGLVAMAMVVVGLLDVLLDLGVGAALIQNSHADADDFHTAWTLRMLQSAVVAALLLACAPLVAHYYDDDRVTDILRVVAVTALVGGLENIGTVSFQKNMEFGRDFRFFFFKRMIGVVIGIAAALALRSYWALVLGSLVSRLAGVAISYQMSAFRPRISFARFSQIWSFSQWNLVVSVGTYLSTGIARFVIGRRDDAATLGAYSMGDEIASLPTTELLAPLGRVMFPVFAAAKHDPAEMLRLVSISLAVQTLVAMPAGIGLALVANDAIPVLLGPHWAASIPFAKIIALASIATALSHSGFHMLAALGRMKTLAAIMWSKVLLLLLLVVVVFPESGARGVALAVLGSAYGALIALPVLARHAVPGLGLRTMLKQAWRPLLSTAVMCSAVLATSRILDGAAPFVRLVVEVGVGAFVYGASVLALWRLAGSPPGAETYLLEKLTAWNRLRPAAQPGP